MAKGKQKLDLSIAENLKAATQMKQMWERIDDLISQNGNKKSYAEFGILYGYNAANLSKIKESFKKFDPQKGADQDSPQDNGFKLVLDIADYLECNVDYIIFGTGPKERESISLDTKSSIIKEVTKAVSGRKSDDLVGQILDLVQLLPDEDRQNVLQTTLSYFKKG